MFALIDCNNFFASCEQVFNPKLRGKPLVILSNNDGCIIARSAEAKALGIPMGAPAFEYRDMARNGHLLMLSSNFVLYGDLSHRVMETAATFGYEMEIYSIDEAFLQIDANPEEVGYQIRNRIKQWVGIPISVGIAPTKTLAKVANKKAKKENGICVLTHDNQIAPLLQKMPVDDVWGIGRAIASNLNTLGVHTALEFRQQEDYWIKKHFNVLTLQTAMELRGTPCMELNDAPAPRKSILCSRSFYQKIESLPILSEEVCKFTARAAEKLREENLRTHALTVFITTSPFQEPYYSNSCTITIPIGTAVTSDLITLAKAALQTIFRPSYGYKRAGIHLTDFIAQELEQPDFFATSDDQEKKMRLMKTMDRINYRYDKEALFFAAEGTRRTFRSLRSNSSPRYTTSWNDIPKVKL